jgi:hypothetical protein
VDPELREALDRLAADLRGEIRSSNGESRVYIDGAIQASAAETRAYIDERVQTSAAETRAYIDERLQTSTAETRRYFDVVAESLRGDIRGVAEGMVLSSERLDRRFAKQTQRSGELEGRVLRLEVRMTALERDRRPRRRRRRP